MARAFNVAVLGATGLVGQQMMDILAERDFPVARLFPLASSRSAGATVSFKGEDLMVEDAENFDWSQVELGFSPLVVLFQKFMRHVLPKPVVWLLITPLSFAMSLIFR